MKFLGILISFALVGHVLAIELDDYIEEVILTNENIRQAKDFMPEIIKSIVMNAKDYWPEIMAFMLAVPECIDSKLQTAVSDISSDSDGSENTVHVEHIGGTLEGQGSGQNQIPSINIDPSTDSEEGPGQNQIPLIDLDPDSEEGVNNPSCVAKTIILLKRKLEYQKIMQLAILAVTDRAKYEDIMQSGKSYIKDTAPVPVHKLNLNRRTVSDKTRIDAPIIKLENLASVLTERNIHPRAISRIRTIRAFGLKYLGRVRRKMTLKAITSLIRQNDPVFQNLYNMCRLVALFRSIKYPHSYIATTMLDEEYCVLEDVLELEGFQYKFHDGEFWEVDVDSRTLYKRFLSEL